MPHSGGNLALSVGMYAATEAAAFRFSRMTALWSERARIGSTISSSISVRAMSPSARRHFSPRLRPMATTSASKVHRHRTSSYDKGGRSSGWSESCCADTGQPTRLFPQLNRHGSAPGGIARQEPNSDAARILTSPRGVDASVNFAFEESRPTFWCCDRYSVQPEVGAPATYCTWGVSAVGEPT